MRDTFSCFTALSLWLLVHSKGISRQLETNKQFVAQHLEEGNYEVVHPFQVRDKKERVGIDTRNYFLNASVHYKQVVIVIRANYLLGTRLKLLLNLNDYVFFNQTQFIKLNAKGESAYNKRVENCYYQGTVNGDPASFVALSTCDGIRGIIAFENGTALGIWPLDGAEQYSSRKHPHFLYRVKWTKDASCGALTQLPQHRMFAKRDVRRQAKHVELALIADHHFMKQLNLTEEEGIHYMLEAINIADLMLTRDLNVRLTAVYVEMWTDEQRVDILPDVERTLSQGIEYTTGHIYHVEKDASLIFTGATFASNEVMSASFSSICTPRAVGILKAVDTFTVHDTAQLLAHDVGHTLGIDHDSADCTCTQWNLPCVMNRHAGYSGSAFAWKFSKCSVARMHSVLQSGHVQCLFNKPFQTSRLHQCGNGIVDGDEQCDCGRRDECTDPCCDPITCTLRAHAQCASHQPCCHRCELRKAGHVCRESRSVCDVPEVCDGESGNCPPDGYLVDGIACGINGHCWKGNCSDTEQQCKELWGPSAQAAFDYCYDHNEKGTEYSNCGTDAEGSFTACAPENKMCGTLHCREGSTSPIHANLSSFNLQFAHEGRQVQCKAITSPSIGLVRDGTSCAPGKVCVDSVCLPMAQISPPIHCPSNNLALQCSGHGDCTTTQKCLCYEGYDGIACDIRTNVTRRMLFPTPASFPELVGPSFKVGRTLETTTLLGILLLVGVALLLLLVCLLFSYRRRTAADIPRIEGTEKLEESFHENGNRGIRFGAMPSYSEEKRKCKKNKRVYAALQRINEATDERDSVSLKSRESATVASLNSQIPNGSMANVTTHLYERHPEATEVVGMYETHHLREGIDAMPNGYGGDRRCNGDAVYAETACMDYPLSHGEPMAHSSPTPSDYAKRSMQRPSERNGYGTDTETGGAYSSRYMSRAMATSSSAGLPHSGASSLAGSMTRLAPTPLKLSNIQMLLKQLNSDDAAGESEPELSRLMSHGNDDYAKSSAMPAPDPPPASADSGHPGSNCDVRDSPSLFSDPFKLEMST